MAAEQEKELKPVNRGWILIVSILYEVVTFLGIYCLIKFLPISIGWWKILLGVGGVLGMSFLTFGLIYWWWAPNNLFFTFVKEGTAKVVVRAHQYGKTLIQFKNHTFDDNGDVIVVFGDERNTTPKDIWVKVGNQGTLFKNGEILDVIGVVDEDKGILRVRKKIFQSRKRDRIEETEMEKLVKGVRCYQPIKPCKEKPFFGGLKYYGFWPIADIFTYKFAWVGIKENGEFEPHPAETLDYIIVKDDVYGLLVEKAEDKELMPLDVKLTLTVRIVNPYKALFVPENWYETMMNRVRPYVRDFITTNTYEKFIAGEERIDLGVWERLESEGILNEFISRYGVEVRKIEVSSIDPVEKFREAVMAKVLALRGKDTIITNAEAEKARLTTVAQGEKNRISTVYGTVQSFGEIGERIRTLEALEKSPEGGAKWVVPLPGMADILSQVFSKKRPFHSGPKRNQNGRNTSNQR